MHCRSACRPISAHPRQPCCAIRQAPAAVTAPRRHGAHWRTVPKATGAVNGSSDVQGPLPGRPLNPANDKDQDLKPRVDALEDLVEKLIAGNLPGSRLLTVDAADDLYNKALSVRQFPADGYGTASQKGNDIKARAQLLELVQVTDAGRALAQELLKAAGPAGAAWVTATQAQSKLPEQSKGACVQTVVSDFVKAQQWDERCRMWDTHNVSSICGDNLKPDLLISLGPDKPLASSTKLAVDLKRQDETFTTGANFYQLVQCGAAVFNQLPPTSRAYLLLAVTDLKSIQLLAMMRGPDNDFSYQLSSVMPNVLEVLCSILASTTGGDADARGSGIVPPQFGAGPPPNLIVKGKRLQLLSLLGHGATSIVYECQLGKQRVAAKVLKDPVDAVGAAADLVAHEVDMLQEVKDCDGVVQMAGVLDSGCGFVLRPVGKTLTRLGAPLEVPRLFEAIERLLRTVHSVHDLGIVHRDLRGTNLLLDGYVIRITDWGYAVNLAKLANGVTPSFAGALLCASNRALKILDSGAMPQPVPADDLETLAKSVYLLLHPSSDIKLHRLGAPPRHADILNFWVSELKERPSWQNILDLARACNYDALGKALRNKLE